MAATPDELWRKRAELKTHFNTQNIDVEEMDHPPDVSSLAARLESALKEGDAFVQLLGRASGWHPDLPDGFVVLQNEIAERSGVPVFQWFDPRVTLVNIDDEDDEGAACRQWLERRWNSLSHEPLDRFATQVAEKLKELGQPPRPPADSLCIFVDADRDTREHYEQVWNIIQELVDRRGCHWLKASSLGCNGTPGVRDLSRNDILKKCDWVILVHGVENFGWVWEQIIDLDKTQLAHPIRVAVLETPPPPPRARLAANNVKVLNCTNGISPEILKDYFEELARTRGTSGHA